MGNIAFEQFMVMDNAQLELVNGGWTAEQWIVGACTGAGVAVGAAIGFAVGGPITSGIGGKVGGFVSAAAGVAISSGCGWVANQISSAIIGK